MAKELSIAYTHTKYYYILFHANIQDCIGKQLSMKELRVILGHLLLNYEFSLQSKHMNMKNIPCKGGVRGGVAKPMPQIPVIVKSIHYH